MAFLAGFFGGALFGTTALILFAVCYADKVDQCENCELRKEKEEKEEKESAPAGD